MKILVAYDGSEPSRKALNKAVELVGKTGGALSLIMVTESVCPLGITPGECANMDEILQRQTETLLKGVKADLAARTVEANVTIRSGSPAQEIVKHAEEIGAEMIVLGSHGRHGIKRFLLGSVSDRVAGHADCTVMIVR